MRARAGLCALVLWANAHAQAPPAVELRLVPAWDGLMQPGGTTEVSVTVRAPEAMDVEITAHSDGLEVTRRVALAPATATTTHLLVRVRAETARVEVVARGTVVASQAIALRATSRPIVAVAAPGVPRGTFPDEIAFVHPPLASLPRHAEAYENVHALVVSAAQVDALDEEQRAALADYAADCGRLVLVDGPGMPADLSPGCGGRYARTAAAAAALAATAALLAQALPALPESAALRALSAAPEGHIGPLAGLLGAYALVLVLFARVLRRPALLLGVPALATLVAIAGFTTAPARIERASWVEMESGDARARGVLITSVTGRARGREGLDAPAGWQLPAAVDGTPVVVDGAGRIVLGTGLLSSATQVARGVLPAPASLELVIGADGPRVTNTGAAASAPAVLSWRGERYDVPALAPAGAFAPRRASAWRDAAAERLLRARAGAGAALLVPAQDPQAPGASWLLVRARGAR